MADSWNLNAAPALPYIMEIIKNQKGNDLYEQLQQKANAGDYSPISGSWFVDPKETYQANQKLKELQDTREAQPYMQGLMDTMQAGFDSDPQYQADAKAILSEYAAKMPGNPVLTGAAKEAQGRLNSGLIIADAATDMQGNGYMKPMTLAQLASQKDGNTTIERLIAMNKQQDEAKRLGGQQAWLRASGGLSADPKLRALAEATQYGVTPEMFNSTAKTYGLDPVDLKPVDTGTGNGNERQVVAFNPRTGATGQRVGNTWTPESMRVINNIQPEAITASALKAFGPQIMNDTGKRTEEATKKADLQRDYVNMFKLLNAGSPTGWGSETTMDAKRIAAALGFKADNLNNQQLFDAISKGMSSKAVRTTDANPTEKQVFMLQKTYPNLSQEQARNMAQIQLAIQANRQAINQHNIRVQSFKKMPAGDTLGAAMIDQYTVADPASGMVLPSDPIAEMNGKKPNTAKPKNSSEYLKKLRGK